MPTHNQLFHSKEKANRILAVGKFYAHNNIRRDKVFLTIKPY